MRAPTPAFSGLAAALAAIVMLSGCGSGNNTSPSGSTQVVVDNTINYGSTGTTADIDCADGKSLNVGGSNNTLTVKGTCSSVNIGGAENKITFQKIDKDLSVIGVNNTVTYKDGNPKVSDVGSGNKVNKG
jgi:hypothetical protein